MLRLLPRSFTSAAAAVGLSFSLASVVNAQGTSAPRVAPWRYDVSKCTNFSSIPTIAQDCRSLDGGIWAGSGTGSDPFRCESPAHPRPWSLEAFIEPKISAREGAQSAVFSGWLSEGEQTSCTGAWSGGVGFTLGVESTNLGIVAVGDGTVTDYMARRDRPVACPEGYQFNGASCQLPPGVSTLHKNNDVCPAFPNGSNPVHSYTGRKLQQETDYRGNGVFPLRFTRYYSSGKRGYFGGSYMRFANLGSNWRHSYAREVVLVESGGLRTATAVRPNGNEYFFNENSQGEWIGDPDVVERLDAVLDSGALIGWRYTTIADEVEAYDAAGRLLSITNREGFTQTLSYDLSSAEGGDDIAETLDRVTGPFEKRSLHFSYTGDGRIARITVLPGGEAYRFEYTGPLLTKVVYPDVNDDPNDPASYNDNPFRRYAYDESAYLAGNPAPASLTGIFDEAGARYAGWWYADDRVVRSQLAPDDLVDVNRVELQYHADGTRTITDALGTARVYGFEVLHGVAKIGSITGGRCEVCGSPVQHATYDVNGYEDEVADFNGNVTDYDYDSRGLEVQRIEAKGSPDARTTRTEWHPSLRLPTRIDRYAGEGTSGAHVGRTEMHYANGRLMSRIETDPASGAARTWTYSYDSHGLLAAVDGPRTDVADVTSFDYVDGDLVRVTNALSQAIEIAAHDAHGNPTRVLDPNGVSTTFTYDARQRLTSRTTAGETVIFDYWPTGLLRSMTLPDGSRVEYSYDAAHRLVAIADGDGNRVVYTLDPMGNRVREETTDTLGALVRLRARVYDELNQIIEDVGAAGTAAVTTSYGYDGVGNLTHVWAPLGRNRGHSYDALDRLREVRDAEGGSTELAYDARGNVLAVTDPRGLTTAYLHNGFDELERVTSPDSGTTRYGYDAAGNLTTRTDARGRTALLAYDALDRLRRISYPDRTLLLTYDAGANGIGRLTGAADADHSMTWVYDGLGRVTRKQQTVDGIERSVGYAYTAGNLTTVVLPSGHEIRYDYTNDRPTSVILDGSTTILHRVEHEPFGPPSGWTWGNGSVTRRSYDADGNLVGLYSAEGFEYTYDAARRIVGIAATERRSPASRWSYRYDLLDRLTGAERERYRGTPALSQTWSYDANGNRSAETGTRHSSYTVSPTSNRLASVTGSVSRSFAYDAAGNVIGDGTHVFTYDDAGRLVAVPTAGTTYGHNAQGERVKKAGPSGTRHFVYDEAGRLLGEYDASGEAIQETVWLGDIPVAMLKPGRRGVELLYVHTDHLDAPRRITRPSDDRVLWSWDPDPFGAAAATANGVEYNLRLPGQYFDEETGLHYNYFRDYDPATGRYVQSDPIGLEAGINTYGYALQNPIDFFDSDGLEVAVQWHRVWPSPFFHTLVRVTPCDQDAWETDARFDRLDGNGRRFLTLGAGPALSGRLENGINRTADAEPHADQIVVWDPAYDGCGCSDENRQIANLLALHEAYSNRLDYDLFPGFQNSYNSNSYTSGLLDAAGILKIKPPVSTPGWNTPLPAEYFRK